METADGVAVAPIVVVETEVEAEAEWAAKDAGVAVIRREKAYDSAQCKSCE